MADETIKHAKASLMSAEKDNEPDSKVEFLFNPPDFEIKRTINWVQKKRKGHDTPMVTYDSSSTGELSLRLLFDTYEVRKDVRDVYTNKLAKLAQVNSRLKDAKTGKGRPPHVLFSWGKFLSFRAVIRNFNQKFTLFLEDGTPVRAEVNLTLIQVDDEKNYPRTNPTSGGNPGYRGHVVRLGDRLDLLAAREYGDAQHWRYIADCNDIANPFELAPGTVLSLPPLA